MPTQSKVDRAFQYALDVERARVGHRWLQPFIIKTLYCRVIALLPRAQRSASLLPQQRKTLPHSHGPFPPSSYPCLSVWLSLPHGSRHVRPCSTGVGGARGGQTPGTRPQVMRLRLPWQQPHSLCRPFSLLILSSFPHSGSSPRRPAQGALSK